ncbi:hypothetical protein GQ600_650 [Phytophthora cactorum]|nr:hypothetical protein GQ600_650 [Phytophthora cactorum]
MKFTNKDLYALLFTELSPNQARCNICLKVYNSGNGYTNQEVSKALQDPTLTLMGVRRAFDWVVRQYPSMKERLASDAAVVNYPALETGITKIITGNALVLGPCFSEGDAGPYEIHLQVAWVPPTSNECEIIFFAGEMVYTDMRKSMNVNTLDVLMFLAYNRDSWDVGSVQAITQDAQLDNRIMQ